jgi:LDH2 family malate/lactate/ureidoglycolate dehydrogenase
MNAARALLLEPNDDVAAALEQVVAGRCVAVTLNASGEVLREIQVRQAIPFGHKLAVRSIGRGDMIRRYGYPIGAALADIAEGEHVHTHNMRSLLSKVSQQAAPEPLVRPAPWVQDLVKRILEAAGALPEAADAMASALTEAHLRGVETHGLRRLRPYVARIRSGGVDAKAQPRVQYNRAALSIDGRNGIGHHVAAYAARAVSDSAREHGIALALVRNSNHFGFAGYYATLIAQREQLGIVTSNGQVCVGPEGAKMPFLSNNPLAIAAPTGRNDAFLELDLATSITSRANIVEAAKSRTFLPSGWAQDREGQPTRDPKAALDGSLLAFGGPKGFALLLALETLTGVLSGGAYGEQVSSKEAAPEAPEGTVHMMIAIDLNKSIGTDAFSHRLDDLLQRLAGLPMKDGAPQARYPGERRWRLRRDRMRQGIPLSAAELNDALGLARELGVDLP